MQSMAAIVSGVKFALTNDPAEFRALMVGAKVNSAVSCEPSIANTAKVWLIGSAVCDVVITGTMIVIVSSHSVRLLAALPSLLHSSPDIVK